MLLLRALLIMALVAPALLEANSVNQEIESKNRELSRNIGKERRLAKRLEELGEEINRQNGALKELERRIMQSVASLQSNLQEHRRNQENLERLQTEQKKLENRHKTLQDEVVSVLAREVAFGAALRSRDVVSVDDLMLEEIFKILGGEAEKNLKRLSQEQGKILQQSQGVSQEVVRIRRTVQEENRKYNELNQMQARQKELVASLDKERRQYDAELKKTIQERESLKQILSELQITKAQEKSEPKESPSKTHVQQPSSARSDSTPSSGSSSRSDLDVRQVASSYQNVPTIRYRGAKTIAPLDRFRIERRFGPYYDPVYKMKVFNESVILHSLEQDASVRSVLDGKVVLAKETPMLRSVVIIEHADNLHTVYANLDRIAPAIRAGTPIKKGRVIGRVENRLIFEVTSRENYVNPLDLISER